MLISGLKLVAKALPWLPALQSTMFYPGIAILFLLYGYYRAVRMPGMSVVLTVISLGTRVVLSYALAATSIGVSGIWWSIPIGWALADVVGVRYYRSKPNFFR